MNGEANTESVAPPAPDKVALDALIGHAELMRFAEAVAELTQMECSVLLHDPAQPRSVSADSAIQIVRAPICRALNEACEGGSCRCELDVHSAAHRAMASGEPVTAGCIAGDDTLFACPIMLRHGDKLYPKAAIVAAATDVYNFHFADRLAALMGRSVAEAEDMMCDTDKRCLNAAQLRRLRAIIEGQARSFSLQISDRYAQMGYLATIVSQKEELAGAYDQLDGEFKIVGALQQSLVPAESPALPGYAFATHYSPARRAGGDYFDFLPQADGACGILVADVSGHGPPAAVVMAMMRAILHAFPGPLTPLDALVEYMNRHLCRSVMPDQFATAFFGVLDPDGRLHAASAGHDPPLIFEAKTGAVKALALETGYPLGVMTEIELPWITRKLSPGDVLLVYTDGVTDTLSPSGEKFGADRLARILRSSARSGANGVRDAVVAELHGLAAGRPPDDDQTLLVIERR